MEQSPPTTRRSNVRGGCVDQRSVSFSSSALSLAIMNSYVMIVQDGVKKKILVVRVFWFLVEGDYVYGKKRIIDDIDPDPHGTGIIQLHNSYNSGEECELALERSYFEDEVEEEVIELTFEDNLCV